MNEGQRMGNVIALKPMDQERRGISKEENSHPGVPGLRSTTDCEGNSYFLGNLVANLVDQNTLNTSRLCSKPCSKNKKLTDCSTDLHEWESASLEAENIGRCMQRETKHQDRVDFASRAARLKRKEERSQERDCTLRTHEALLGTLFFAFLHSAVRQSWRSRFPILGAAQQDHCFGSPSVQSA